MGAFQNLTYCVALSIAVPLVIILPDDGAALAGTRAVFGDRGDHNWGINPPGWDQFITQNSTTFGRKWTREGTAGNDTITGGSGRDTLFGLGGNDHIRGGRGHDHINGGSGNDLIDGGTGNDRIDGSSGNDGIDGGFGRDRLYGGSGNDKLYGQQGDDTLYGGSGNDKLYGNYEDDTLYGGTGNDLVDGGQGDDKLYGGAGHDVLSGGDNNDTLNGGAGNDTFNGGSGTNRLTGGSGSDTFVFNSDAPSYDTITDFTPGVDEINFPGHFNPGVTSNAAGYAVISYRAPGAASTNTVTLIGVRPGQLGGNSVALTWGWDNKKRENVTLGRQ